MTAPTSIQTPNLTFARPKLAALTLALASLLTTFVPAHDAEATPAKTVQQRAAVNEARLDSFASELRNNADAAAEMVRWVQQQAPGDAHRQAQILTDFADALEAEGAGDRVVELLYSVVQNKEVEFEPALIDRLGRNASADQLVRASKLSYRGGLDASRIGQLLHAALEKDPDNLLGWYLNASQCLVDEACAQLESAENLVRLDPDNGYAWLLLANARRGGQAAQDALHEAAQKVHFDDYFALAVEAHARALEQHMALETPTDRGSVYVTGETERIFGTKIMALIPSLPPLGGFAKLCKPANLPADAANLRADCVTIGKRLAHDAGSEFNNDTGAIVVSRLAAGTPLDTEMRELRARIAYLNESQSALPIPEYFGYPYNLTLQAIRDGGNLAVYERQLAYFGHPTTPPAGWTPKDPEVLLLPEERNSEAAPN